MPPSSYRPPTLAWQVFRGSAAIRDRLLTRHQLRSASWVRLMHDVYADARLDRDHELLCRAAILRLPPGVVVAGPSAAYLHGIEHAATFTDDVHVLAPTHLRLGSQRRIRVHTLGPRHPSRSTSENQPPPPPRDPATPPRDRATPPRDPATPPRDPATPPRNPATSPRDPATPPRNPATPPRNPATPPRDRATPLARRSLARQPPAAPAPRPQSIPPATPTGATSTTASATTTGATATAGATRASRATSGSGSGSGSGSQRVEGPDALATPAGSQPVLRSDAVCAAWECAVWLEPVPAVGIIDAMLRQQLVDHAGLSAVARANTGRPGGRRAEWVFGLADAGAQSPPESQLRVRLILAGLPRPVTQHPVRLSNGRVLHPDLCWPEYRVAVEYDGHWHTGPEQIHLDRQRLNQLVAAGWRVLHVTSRRLHRDFPGVLREIRTVLTAAGWPR